jgi:hypothetical protein
VSNRDEDDEALLVELRRLDDGAEPPPELWQAMADEVRAGYQRALAESAAATSSPAKAPNVSPPARPRRWRSRTLATATTALALAAALTLWLRPPRHLPGAGSAPHAIEQLDEMTVFGDELDPGDELEEMSATQLDEIDSAFKKGA